MDEIFVIKQVESTSPISKRPGSPFRNNTMFLSETSCVGEVAEECSELSTPYPLPVVSDMKRPTTGSVIYLVREGEDFSISGIYTKERELELYVKGEGITYTGEGNFKADSESINQVWVKYTEGEKECKFPITVHVVDEEYQPCDYIPVIVPEEPTIPVEPTLECRVHFTGLLMTATNGNGVETTAIWEEDEYSEILLAGEYPVAKEAFPKAFNSSLDGVAIGAGTRVEVWSEENFQGDKIFDNVGALILNRIVHQYSSEQMVNDDIDSHLEFSTVYPLDRRLWIDLNEWVGGSMKITCGDDYEEPVVHPPMEIVEIECGGIYTAGENFQVFKLLDATDSKRYTIRVDTFGVPDDVYVYVGDPTDGGTMIASKAMDESMSSDFYYFDVEGTDEPLFIQFNTILGVDEYTAYTFTFGCMEYGVDVFGIEPLGNTLPEPFQPNGTFINCGQLVSEEDTVFKRYAMKVHPTETTYCMRVDVLGASKDLYVYVGDPENGGDLVASKRLVEEGYKYLHFDTGGAGEIIYVQFDTEDSTKEGTDFKFSIDCQCTPTSESEEMWAELPNPY